MFSYIDEFYKAAAFHFVVSAVCAALFALGLEFSSGSDGDSVPYFMPAMVLSGINFILCVIAVLLFCVTKRKGALVRSYNTRSRKYYTNLKSLYTLINFPSFLWSIVGASITGSSGICAKENSKCYYTVNIGINRALAIIILVIHIMNGFVVYMILSTSRSPSRTGSVVPHSNILRINNNAEKISYEYKTASRVNNTSSSKDNCTENTKPTNNIVLLKKLKRRQYSDLGPVSRLTQKRDQMSQNVPEMKQFSRVADYTPPSNEVKPLPRKNRKLILPAVGKLVLTFNHSRSKRTKDAEIDEKPALALAESSSYSSSSDEEIRPVNNKKKFSLIRSSTSGQSQPTDNVPPLRPPPPSYNDIISVADRGVGGNPYWLPSITHADASRLTLPENIYSGTAYPDTELVVVEPSHVPQR